MLKKTGFSGYRYASDQTGNYCILIPNAQHRVQEQEGRISARTNRGGTGCRTQAVASLLQHCVKSQTRDTESRCKFACSIDKVCMLKCRGRGCHGIHVADALRRPEASTKTVLTLTFILINWWLVTAADTRKQAANGRNEVARGKYIVEQVAMCVQCHTPRSQNGQLLQTRYLQGAPVPVSAPAGFRSDWAYKAPAIAGLPGYTRQDGIKLLMEGITPDGRIPKAPMPKYRLIRTDAEAVVEYLKSIS